MNKICIVGNADSLLDKKLGSIIDSHEIVVRINQPIIKGFEEHVGYKVNHLYIASWMLPQNIWQPDIRTIIRGDSLRRLGLYPTEKKLFLNQQKNYNLDMFYEDTQDIICDTVNIEFIDLSKTSPIPHVSWKDYGFRKHPFSGSRLLSYYTSLYGSIDICGFGTLEISGSTIFCHYWDINYKMDGDIYHDVNENLVYVKDLMNRNLVTILDL